MTTRATAREQREQQSGARRALRAPRSARPVAAGDRTFRRRCRLSNRQKTSCIFAESAATYFLPLTKWFRLLFSAGPMLPSLHMPTEITARSKVDFSRVARLFGHNSAVRRWQITLLQSSKRALYLSAKPDRTNHYFIHYQTLICHMQTRQFVPHVGRGSIGLWSNNAPVRAAVDEHWRV